MAGPAVIKSEITRNYRLPSIPERPLLGGVQPAEKNAKGSQLKANLKLIKQRKAHAERWARNGITILGLEALKEMQT